MATQPSRTETVGIPDWNLLIPNNVDMVDALYWSIRKSNALRLMNGRYQARKLRGLWCVISPTGNILMYSPDAAKMRRWAIRLANYHTNGDI